MTITVAPARNEYTANASQTIFNYTFKIFASTDLNVYITPTGQLSDDSTDLTTAYTVTGLGDEDGGTITLSTGTSLNDLVTIVSNVPSSRTTDYQNNGDFRPEVVNADFDTVVSITKKIEDTVNRTLVLPQSQQGPKPLSLPSPVAQFLMRWKGDLSGLENISFSELSPGTFPNDAFTLQSTLAAAKVDVNVLVNQVYIFSDRDSALFDVISGTGSANGFNVVGHDTLNLSFVLRISGTLPTVEQWGAPIDGTDAYPATQNYITYIEDNNYGVAYFPVALGQIYSLESTVIVRKGIALSGDMFATTKVEGLTRGHITCGGSNLIMFDYGNSEASNPTAQLNVDKLNFLDPANNKTFTAIHFTQANDGPHRGFNFTRCSGSGLDVVVHFEPPGNQLAVANFTMEACNFGNCNDVARETGTGGGALGLRVVNCQIEQGARIKGNFTAGVRITDNMIEGQSNPIDIDAGATSIIIENNYGEAISGDFVANLKATNARASIFQLGYIYNLDSITSTDIYRLNGIIGSVIIRTPQITERIITLMRNAFILPNSSTLNGGGYKVEANASDNTVTTLPAIQYLGSEPVTFAAKNDSDVGATPFFLPHGTGTGVTITTGSHQQLMDFASVAGETIVMSILYRMKDTSSVPSTAVVQFQNLGGATQDSINVNHGRIDGGWLLTTVTVGAYPSAHSNTNIEFFPYGLAGSGVGCDIAGFAIYGVSVDGDTRSIVYPVYPFN